MSGYKYKSRSAKMPDRLTEIAAEIKTQLESADGAVRAATDAIEKLLAEARGLCDRGGFDKFCKSLNLSKSRAYELLAVAKGKTTLLAIRATNRARQRKSRANKKAAAASDSVTVTEKAVSKPVQIAVVANISNFDAIILELSRKTKGRSASHFIGTAVNPGDLRELARFLTDVAELRQTAANETESQAA